MLRPEASCKCFRRASRHSVSWPVWTWAWRANTMTCEPWSLPLELMLRDERQTSNCDPNENFQEGAIMEPFRPIVGMGAKRCPRRWDMEDKILQGE